MEPFGAIFAIIGFGYFGGLIAYAVGADLYRFYKKRKYAKTYQSVCDQIDMLNRGKAPIDQKSYPTFREHWGVYDF